IASDAYNGCGCHRTCCSRSDDSELRAHQFGQPESHNTLKFNDVDKVTTCFYLSITNFQKLQQSTQIDPYSTAIYHHFDTEATINIPAQIQPHCSNRFF